MTVAALLFLAAACQPQNPAYVAPTPRPTPQGTEESYFRGFVDCSDEIYTWETLDEVAALNNTDSRDIAGIAEASMTFALRRPSLKAVEGCRDGLREGVRSIDRAEATGWKPWGNPARWFAYRSQVFFCYTIFRDSGDIYTLAEKFNFRVATVHGIANTLAKENLSYDAAYEGCSLGLIEAQADRKGLWDGPQGYT